MNRLLWSDEEYRQNCGGISKSTSARQRREGTGPPYLKIGQKVYDAKIAMAWLDTRFVNSTAEADQRDGTRAHQKRSPGRPRGRPRKYPAAPPPPAGAENGSPRR